MQLIKITHTDQWESTASQRFIGLAHEMDDAIELARKDTDAMKDVQNQEGKIIFEWVTVGELESEARIGGTGNDEFRAKLSFPTPEGWKKCDEYGCFYSIQYGEIMSRPQYLNDFISVETFEDDSEVGAIDSAGFSPEEEVPFMEEFMALFDLEAETLLTLDPIMYFSKESINKFKSEYA